ncbi:tetratricopeptide repeat protein [Spirosoma aerolatum]|uniref:tetratricopeptide repeat protein n=1 Tax=Spirosoma aerolatum TaxID=1211326 RepID=UPI0009ABE284|nr:tetratricopeptide repeat protein [Spirosoma aerolatum]
MRTTRYRLILCQFLVLTLSITSQGRPLISDEPSGGIRFFKGSWQQVLAEAKRQNKPVFVDVYTTWCPPCKRMAKEAFPNPKIGSTFNVHFINYQLDAEKGEGIDVAKLYAVASYPTALYITPDGALIHRAVGYGGINGMLDQVEHVLRIPALKATLVKGDKDFANGRRDPEFLKKYLVMRQSLGRPTSDVLDVYLTTLSDSARTAPETIAFIANNLQTTDSQAFDFLIRNRPPVLSADPVKRNLATTVLKAILRTLDNDYKQAVSTTDETLLEKIIANSERNTTSANPFMQRTESIKQEAATSYRLRFFKQTRNFTRYQSIAESEAQSLMAQSVTELHTADSLASIRLQNMMRFMPDSIKNRLASTLAGKPMNDQMMSWKVAHSLCELADTYRQQGSSTASWQIAIPWIERSLVLYRSHESLHTYAQLLHKLGRNQEALTYQKQAIVDAQKAGWPTDEYESELRKMNP